MRLRRGLAIAGIVVVVALFVGIGLTAALVAARQVTVHDTPPATSSVTPTPSATPTPSPATSGSLP